MSDPQPEYVWAYSDEKRKPARTWLIIGLAVVAVTVAVAVFLALVRPWETTAATPAPSPSASATTSSTPSASPSPTGSATPSQTPTTAPTPVPSVSPPAPADPALPVFRSKVQPLLDDAATGLSYAQDSSGEEGVQIADQLLDDAGRLSDAVAPSPIAPQWSKHVSDYGAGLEVLRVAFEQGASTSSALASARSSLESLVALLR